mmetsp:Transcript_60938/g.168938  ORF Transcript_60938/g.168938 Transcript_60938/m.168938 type:complete len:203 (+) Transcript_60938:142-750(+)
MSSGAASTGGASTSGTTVVVVVATLDPRVLFFFFFFSEPPPICEKIRAPQMPSSPRTISTISHAGMPEPPSSDFSSEPGTRFPGTGFVLLVSFVTLPSVTMGSVVLGTVTFTVPFVLFGRVVTALSGLLKHSISPETTCPALSVKFTAMRFDGLSPGTNQQPPGETNPLVRSAAAFHVQPVQFPTNVIGGPLQVFRHASGVC